MSANMAKLPGVLLALTGSVGFAVGTIFLKRYPIQLPGATSATWQIAIGSVPIALAGNGVVRHSKFRGKCLLWVKSRHWGRSALCPLYPQKRTLGLTAQGLLQLASDLRMAIMELERYRLRVSRAGQDGDSAAKK